MVVLYVAKFVLVAFGIQLIYLLNMVYFLKFIILFDYSLLIEFFTIYLLMLLSPPLFWVALDKVVPHWRLTALQKMLVTRASIFIDSPMNFIFIIKT